MYLKGEKYLLKGRIHVELSSLVGAYTLPNTIIVDMLDGVEAVVGSGRAEFLSDGNGQPGDAVYEYSVWARRGDKLTFIPRDSRYIQLGIIRLNSEHSFLILIVNSILSRLSSEM